MKLPHYQMLKISAEDIETIKAEWISDENIVLESAKAVRDFLSDKECCSTEYWDSDRNVIMHTDIGYFDEGLQELIEYLEGRQDNEREVD